MNSVYGGSKCTAPAKPTNTTCKLNSKWVAAPVSVSLEAGQVHVWRIGLKQPDDLLEQFRRTLEPDELDRARRFRFERLQRHFVVGRGFLRYVLGQYLQASPADLSFSYNDYGKPLLAGEHSLRFNLSHSHEVALVAVARDAAVGVDVEHIRADFASDEIARRFFRALRLRRSVRCRRKKSCSVFQMLDAEGSLYQSDRERIVTAARRLRRDARA